jgi:SnoaL-like domain
VKTWREKCESVAPVLSPESQGKDISMNRASMRSPLVRRAIEAINQGKLDDFMTLFAPDATVVDVSPYSGHEAIRV